MIALVLAILSISLIGSGTVSPLAQQLEGPIQVRHMLEEVRFPDEIRFTLETYSPYEIQEVKLFYRFGEQRYPVYGYPTFTPNTRINATFTVKTSGRSYVPPGTEIEYRYLIKDSQGRLLDTGPTSFVYMDPRFDWNESTRGLITFMWHDRSESGMERRFDRTLERFRDVQELLDMELRRPVRALLYNDHDEAQEAFPFLSEATNREHVYKGFAYPAFNVFLLAETEENGMVHELTHLLLHQNLALPRVTLPAWLDEGLAMYFEPGPSRRGSTLARAAQGRGLIPLGRMGTVPGRPEDIATFYAQSQSLVAHLMEEYGEELMPLLLSSLNRGQPLEEAFLEVYGVGPRAIEDEWRAKVISQARFPTSGEISALLLAGAVALAILTLIISMSYRRLRGRRPEQELEDEPTAGGEV